MTLPPGPRMPVFLQGLGWWHRPTAFMERCRTRYGKRFTIKLPAQPPFVMVSEPDEIREVFTSPPDVLHPGEGARILEPVVGRFSVILPTRSRPRRSSSARGAVRSRSARGWER